MSARANGGAAGGGAISAIELAALRRSCELAVTPGVPLAPNPRVGAVLLRPDGSVIATGYHCGAGAAHAEVAALTAARESGLGGDLVGATAVVSLEPCNHVGRTGPCSQALIEAGVARVVFGQADPNPIAAGGASRLRAAGLEVVGPVPEVAADQINEAWTFAVSSGRPLVTWKVAATLDGRIAAADGTSRWISSAQSRAQVHELRRVVQAVVIGTGTAVADDPSLTARDESGQLLATQPLRVVVGEREIPAGARLRDGSAELLQLRTHSPAEALIQLHARDIRHVLLEGGPTLASAFLRAGLIDRVIWYVASAVMGSGTSAIGDVGVTTIAEIRRLHITGVQRVGPDVRIDARF